MGGSGGKRMEFGFEVSVIAEVAVRGVDGAEARALVEASLDGATATIATGPGIAVSLTRLRLAGTPRLTTIDGSDPLSWIERAIRRFRDGGD